MPIVAFNINIGHVRNKGNEDVKTPLGMCLHKHTWIKAVEHHKTMYLVSVIVYRL
jgi:hypothetical protein